MKQSGLEFDTLQYLAQVPTAGKVRIFVDSKEALDMDQLALLSSRHIDMHLKLEKSAVETKSDLDRLSQVMRGRLTVYTDGSTLPESELAQARSYGTIFKLQN